MQMRACADRQHLPAFKPFAVNPGRGVKMSVPFIGVSQISSVQFKELITSLERRYINNNDNDSIHLKSTRRPSLCCLLLSGPV